MRGRIATSASAQDAGAGPAAYPVSPEPAVAALGISKAYGGTVALNCVDFRAMPGKVNVILGENGAGKSTLMKILAGEERPDSGQLFFWGQEMHFRSPRDARKAGVALIHQELSLFPALSVAENIFVGRELEHSGFVNRKEQERAAAEILGRLDKRIDPAVHVQELTVGQQQQVEIAKALAENARVVIMDEPTSALSDAEVDALFLVIRELVRAGVVVIYISHRMDEIFRIGDHLSVFRDGRSVAAAEAADVEMDWVVEQMLGHDQVETLRRLEAARISTSVVEEGRPPALEIQRAFLPDVKSDRMLLDDVSLKLWRGEIVGIYGLLGAGKTELIETIAGKRPEASATVLCEGKEIDNSLAKRSRAGIAMVPEDRQRDALVGKMSILDNILLCSFDDVARWGFLRRRRMLQAATESVKTLSIKIGDIQASVLSLSGGNQQKVVIARALLCNPVVLLLDEPTRGIDVGAKGEIFQLLRRLADDGLTVLLSSSDLSEVMSATDRIVVLAAGKVRGVFETARATAKEIAAARTRGVG